MHCWGCTCQGGVYLPGRCTCPGECTCPGGVYLPGGTCPGRGVYLPGGECTCPGTPPAVNRMTDRCKNITLPQTSFAGCKKRTCCYVLYRNATENPCITSPALGPIKCIPKTLPSPYFSAITCNAFYTAFSVVPSPFDYENYPNFNIRMYLTFM